MNKHLPVCTHLFDPLTLDESPLVDLFDRFLVLLLVLYLVALVVLFRIAVYGYCDLLVVDLAKGEKSICLNDL